MGVNQHNKEIHENLQRWNSKPLLQKIYFDFYREIRKMLNFNIKGDILEIGSGVGKIKEIIPEAITSDIHANEWLDRQESAYKINFPDRSLSNLILFDVFHHLEYPAAALKEFSRTLKQNGRLIIFEPSMSLIGKIVFGLFHDEPLGIKDKIKVNIPKKIQENSYYAAQSNATRLFVANEHPKLLTGWKIIETKRIAALSYVLSGGFSKPQMYPIAFYKYFKMSERLLDLFPGIFSTRLLIVLENRCDR